MPQLEVPTLDRRISRGGIGVWLSEPFGFGLGRQRNKFALTRNISSPTIAVVFRKSQHHREVVTESYGS